MVLSPTRKLNRKSCLFLFDIGRWRFKPVGLGQLAGLLEIFMKINLDAREIGDIHIERFEGFKNEESILALKLNVQFKF